MSNSRCRRSATARHSTNGSPERPCAPSGIKGRPLRISGSSQPAMLNSAAANGPACNPSQPAPGQRVATAPIRQHTQHTTCQQSSCCNDAGARVDQVEPPQTVGCDDRRDPCPDHHERWGCGVGDHKQAAATPSVISRQCQGKGEQSPPTNGVQVDDVQVVQPKQRPACRKGKRWEPGSKGECGAEESGRGDQQWGCRRFPGRRKYSAPSNAASEPTKTRLPQPITRSGYGLGRSTVTVT
jgi:hypothetical protein